MSLCRIPVFAEVFGPSCAVLTADLWSRAFFTPERQHVFRSCFSRKCGSVAESVMDGARRRLMREVNPYRVDRRK